MSSISDRDNGTSFGLTPLHVAAANNHLETAKLLMVYGANLSARTDGNYLPIDLAANEEIKQAIRDEPRRRMDHGYKRSTEQHPTPLSDQEREEEAEEGENEDEGSEPGDEEDD